jgi:diguanylate cyclase
MQNSPKKSQATSKTEAVSVHKTTSSNVETELERYAQEVLRALGKDSLPPTPNNFSLYFDRLLENKQTALRRQITSILELEENNNDENIIELEKNLKSGFASIKQILTISAALYKNTSIMNNILKKRKEEIGGNRDIQTSMLAIESLENDVIKLSNILTKQVSSLKGLYDEAATTMKNVDNETIFDNKYGIYNKRYLLHKLEQEIDLINEFKHKSSVITIELSRSLTEHTANKKILLMMTRTIARLLLKTSRRSDIVAHYGDGVFIMLLKHTDLNNAIKTSERLIDLVGNSNFFISDEQIDLAITVGIAEVLPKFSTEEIVAKALRAMETAYNNAPGAGYEIAEQS